MTSRSKLPLLIAAIVVMVLGPTQPCAAQGRPSPLGPSLTSVNTLTDEQLAQIKAYAEYWSGILKSTSSRPDEVESARAELVRPMTNIQVSEVFRFEYAKMLESNLREVVEGGNLHAIVNAMIIASMIGGDRSANLLVDHADNAFQPKWQIRLQAAHGAMNVMKGQTIDGRKMQNLADRMRDAAGREENALVLRHQLEAINVADHNPLTVQERQKLRATMVDAIVLVVDRAAKSGHADPPQAVEAIAESISKVRDKYLSAAMTTAERSTLGKAIAPAMGKLLGIVAADWDGGHADERKQRVYSVIIGGLEGFLPAIDVAVRGSQTQSAMRQAWDAGNKANFEAELGKWTAVLQQPQYASGR
jgi:hypothetical protein